MQKNRLELIKSDEVKILNTLNEAKNYVLTASNPNELDLGLNTLASINHTLKIAKKEIKQIEDQLKTEYKTIETQAKELEATIKTRFAELKEVQYEQYMDAKTGEIKTKEIANYEKGRFTYTPSKATVVVDKETLLDDQIKALVMDPRDHDYTLPKLIKEIYVIDEEALSAFITEKGLSDLPVKEITTAEKIGIQFAEIQKRLGKEGE